MKRYQLLFTVVAVVFAMILLPGTRSFATGNPVTLTVYRGDPGDQPTEDNKIYKLIEEKFGIKFDFQFLSGNLDEELGLMIAGGDYPDLFDGGNSADAVIDSGALVNLLDYVSPEKTPRLWEHIKSQRSRLIEQDKDGNDALYIIPNYGLYEGEQQTNSVGGPAFFVQKQVLADAGYPDVKDLTIDEYFDLIEDFMDKHPTDENGNPYTGFAIMCEDWRHYCLVNPVQHLMGRPNDGEVLVDVNSDDLHTETFIDKAYAKAYYKKLNEAYNKGLISSDTFTMNYDQYIAALSSGTVLGMFDQAWDIGSATSALQSAGMNENTYVALGPVYSQDTEGIPDGWTIEEHYINGTLPNVNRGFGISVDCEDPERIVNMWEEMMSDEWQLILNWGIEGEDYYIEDGRLKMTEEQYQHLWDASWRLKNKADGLFTASPKKQGTITKGDLAGNSWEPDNQGEIVYGLMSEYDQEFLAHYGYTKWTDFFNSPIDLAPYGEAWQIDYSPVDDAHTHFLQIQDRRLPEMIMCNPAEFDGKWDEFVEEIEPYATVFEDYMQEQVAEEAARNKPIKCITLPAGLTVIMKEAFMGTSANEYILPKGVQNIGSKAFARLKETEVRIVIPAGNITIADDAFANSDVRIITPKGSDAAKWAAKHGIPWAEK